MVEMEPIENIVKRDRIAASKRPDLGFPIGNLNQIGNLFYAISGKILSTGSGGSDDILLRFTTTQNTLKGIVNFQNDLTSGSDNYFEIKFNNTTVILNKEASSSITEPWTFNIVIPPYTNVVMTWGTQSGASNFNGTVFFSGEVI